MSADAWNGYVTALSDMARAAASREARLEAIERDRQDARSRAEATASAASHDVVALTRRAEGLAVGIRRFAADVGVSEGAPATASPPAVDRIAVALADQEKRLRKSEASREWLARFTRAASDQAAAAAAAQAAALHRAQLAKQAAAAAQPTPAAVAPPAMKSRTLLYVALGAAAVILLVVVVVVVLVVT